MTFVNLLNKCGTLLVRLYLAEAKRLRNRAAAEARAARKLNFRSQVDIYMAAKAVAKAQELDNLFNQTQDTKGDSL